MLGYVILTHGRAPAVFELLEAIYCKEDAYVISVDGMADPTLPQQLLPLAALDNVRLIINRGVNWAAISQVDATVEAMRVLLENFPHVRYLINLSGECFPTRSRSDFVAFLELHPGKSFILTYPMASRPYPAADFVPDSPLFSPSIGRPGDAVTNFSDSPAPVMKKGKTLYVADPRYFFLRNTNRRIMSLNQDRVVEKIVSVCHPPEFFLKVRRHFAEKYSIYWSKTWWVMTREFCGFVLNDELSFHVYDHVRNSWMPDETFFATLMCNSPFADRYVDQSLTYDNPRKARILDEEDVPAIEKGQYFFARKFTEKSQAVKEYYKRQIEPKDLPGRVRPAQHDDPSVCEKLFRYLVGNEGAQWRFGRAFVDQPAYGTLRLGRNGVILDHGNTNERTWQSNASSQELEFRSATGNITTAFRSFVLSRNGRIYLFGTHYRGANWVHYLESEIASHFQRVSMADAIGWAAKLDQGMVGVHQPAGVTDACGGAVGDSGAVRELAEGDRGELEVPEKADEIRCLRCCINGHESDVWCADTEEEAGGGAGEWWKAPFGIVITGLLDLEFAIISRGWTGARPSGRTLLGIGRDYTGRLCAIRLCPREEAGDRKGEEDPVAAAAGPGRA